MAEKKRNIRVLCEIDLEHFDADNILRIKNFSALSEDIQKPLRESCKIVDDGEDRFFISAQK